MIYLKLSYFICSTIKTVLHFFYTARNKKIMSAVYSILRRYNPVEIIRFQNGTHFIQFFINRIRSREMKAVQLMHPPPGLGYRENATGRK